MVTTLEREEERGEMGSVGVFYRVHQLSETQVFSLSHVHDKLSNKLVFQNILLNYYQKVCEACH